MSFDICNYIESPTHKGIACSNALSLMSAQYSGQASIPLAHTHPHMHMQNPQCTELKLSRTDTERRELRESEKEREAYELCCTPICIACPITTQRCQPCYWAPWQPFIPNTHYCLSSHQRTQPFRKKTHHDNWQFYYVLHYYWPSNYAIFPIIIKHLKSYRTCIPSRFQGFT